MNVYQTKREGFINETPIEKPTMPTIEATAEPQAERPRASPPPEMEPSPAEQPPLVQEQWPLVIKLWNKPIRNNVGELVHELKLREPRAGDINRYGNPFRFNQESDIVCDERKMSFMIAALSGILEPFIEDMHPRDWATVTMKLQPFFLPDPRAWSGMRTI
jgi:hypothetical protein